MGDGNNDPVTRTGVAQVGERLPAEVDRRGFFKGVVATTLAGLMAGCSALDGGGDGEGGDGGDPSSSDQMERDITWQTPWEASPEYSPSYVADRENFWEDAGVTGISVATGEGSGDAARRVGTGQTVVGYGNVTPQVTGLNEGHEYKLFGTTKARTLLGLHYNREVIAEPVADNLEGKSVISESALTTQSWPIFYQAVGEPEIEFQTGAEEGAFALFIDGQVDAIWGTVNDYLEISNNADFEVGHLPLYNLEPIYGDPHMVYEPWLQEEGNQEFVTRLLEGYSEAMKWTLLHPEEALEHMKEENPALQAIDDESNLGQIQAGVAALNMTDEVKENGFGYLDEEILQNSFDRIGEVLEVDEIPDASEVGAWEIQDDAELATLSSSEWSQVEEFADPFPGLFE